MIFADTHVLVWLASDDPRLPASARGELIVNGFAVSVVTAFEYAELHRRGRFPSGAKLLGILADFSASVEDLPADSWLAANDLPPIHQDPVDRMLIAHVLVSGATLATADKRMRRYPVPLLW